jgi:Uma2 family endonuclease
LQLANIALCTHNTFQSLESLNRELEVLAMAPPTPPTGPEQLERDYRERMGLRGTDEYSEQERARGGIIEGGGEASGLSPEPDEDNLEKADAETLKAREWDEYVEANPK